MSFGFSVGDFVLLTQLAWTIVQNSRKACGAHDELTREVTSLHIVLQRLQREVEKPNSLINRTDDGRLDELQTIMKGCDRMLRVIDQVLVKYNGMSEEKRRVTRFRLKVQFGNGEMKDIKKIRQELSTYTSAITLFLNLLSMGSQGKVEEHMESHGEELRELRCSLNWITATLQASSGNREGSILRSYADDDKAIWKEFRRELLKEGFSSEELRRHKEVIKDYVMELGARGALDVPEVDEPMVKLADAADKSTDSIKWKEVREEIVPPPTFPSPSSSSSGTLSVKGVSASHIGSHIDDHGDPVHDMLQPLNSSTQSTIHPRPLPQVSTSRLQACALLTLIKPSEAEGMGQGEGLNSILMSHQTGKMDRPGLQSRQLSDSKGSVSEGEIFKERTETVQGKHGEVHYHTPIRGNEADLTLKSSLALARIPKSVSMEEVKDEDFRPGAHPNCEPSGTLADEYDILSSDEYSDDETGASEYEDDQSEADHVSSSSLSPDSWRNRPAPLWREVETVRHSSQSVEFDGSEVGDNGDFIKDAAQNLRTVESSVDVDMARSELPSRETNSLTSDSREAQIFTTDGPPLLDATEIPLWLKKPSKLLTSKDIVEQYGFDPFIHQPWDSEREGTGEACHGGNRSSTAISGSSHAKSLLNDFSEISTRFTRPLKVIDAFAITKSIEQLGKNCFLGRKPESTASTRAFRSRSKGRIERHFRNPRSYSESEDDPLRRLFSPHRKRNGIAHREDHEFLSAGPADTVDCLVDGIIYRIPVRSSQESLKRHKTLFCPGTPVQASMVQHMQIPNNAPASRLPIIRRPDARILTRYIEVESSLQARRVEP